VRHAASGDDDALRGKGPVLAQQPGPVQASRTWGWWAGWPILAGLLRFSWCVRAFALRKSHAAVKPLTSSRHKHRHRHWHPKAHPPFSLLHLLFLLLLHLTSPTSSSPVFSRSSFLSQSIATSVTRHSFRAHYTLSASQSFLLLLFVCHSTTHTPSIPGPKPTFTIFASLDFESSTILFLPFAETQL
jgi:hypothetical protein